MRELLKNKITFRFIDLTFLLYLQSKLNCEVLHDELAFEVRWAVAGESIVIQLVAKLGEQFSSILLLLSISIFSLLLLLLLNFYKFRRRRKKLVFEFGRRSCIPT